MANVILAQYEDHAATLQAKVKIDFLFAHPTMDGEGKETGPALTKNGVKALGLCKVVPSDMRVNGNGDVIIKIDADWWNNATVKQRTALLDHELTHISVIVKGGVIQTDDVGRPKLRLRKHDYEFGWFKSVAARHGNNSIEREQAAEIHEEAGQMFWPELYKETIEA